jgi:hypothetical protein
LANKSVQTLFAITGLSLHVACTRPLLEGDSDSLTDTSTAQQGEAVSCASPATRLSAPFIEADLTAALQDVDPMEDTGLTGEWGMAVSDFDSDGNLDIYLPRFGSGSLLLGDGTGSFTDDTGDRFPAVDISFDNREAFTMGAVALDINADGHPDLVESSVGRTTVLINDGTAHFYDITDTLGLNDTDGMDFNTAWADFDQDGDLDFYLPLYPMEDPTPEQIEAGAYADGVPGKLFENRGADGFVDVSDLLPAETNDGHPFAAGWHDLDGDLRPELIIANDHGVDIRSNRAWRYDGSRFVDISEASGIDSALDSMGLGVGDLNGDGLPDLVFTGWAEFSLLESIESGEWIATEAARDLTVRRDSHQAGWGVEMGDLDNDGDLDIISSFGKWENLPETMDGYDEINPSAQHDAVYIMNDQGTFDEVAADWGLDDSGIGRGLVLADINNDGWLDIIRRRIFDDPIVHLSVCDESAWLTVDLEDTQTANRDGIGARVQVTIAEQTWTRWIRAGGTSIASSGPPVAHFGLGDHDSIDSLTVEWIDGSVSTYTDVPTRRSLTIER